MKEYTLSKEIIMEYENYLISEERSKGTVEKYIRDVNKFLKSLNGWTVTKEKGIAWKEYLYEAGYAPITINSMLASINGLFRFAGWEECRVKFYKIQRKMFRDANKDLKRQEYERLVSTAKKQGKHQIALLMETICATGIRVSEVSYITVEAVCRGQAEIVLKGKIRTIMFPSKLRKKLLSYIKLKKIKSGKIFLTASGKQISRGQIWKEMKQLCCDAKVEPSKVFPHNLRHLFAVTFYNVCKDVVRLADVLGHSNIETTRIYLLTTGTDHARQLEKMELVI